jgi:16S rRNA (uracil1498-N3)-methyltransferase
MSDRFYVNYPLAPGSMELSGPEAHHLATVCRLRPGDQVCLFNGDGREYPARVVAAGRRSVSLDVLAVHSPNRERETKIQVAAPLPKGDRAQFLLEKLTELGVSSFIPLRTRRSVVHPGENKLERLQRYVIEASKQCGRNVLLRVEPLADWESYCRRDDLPTLRALAHPGGQDPFRAASEDVALAVGPEGGFTDEEVEAGRQAGWRVVDLGARILRVETAAMVIATLAGF